MPGGAAGGRPAVEALLDLGFGSGRRHKTARRLRDGRRRAEGLEPGALRAAEGAVRPTGRRAAAGFTRKPKTATRLAA